MKKIINNQNIHPDLKKSPNNSDNENSIFIPNGQSIGASAAIAWIGDAWDFITPKLGMWILMGIIYGAISLGIEFIPYFGFILSNLLEPLFFAGIIAICETQRITGKFELGKLFYGIYNKCGALLAVGIIICGIKILGSLISALLDGKDLYQSILDDLFLYSNYDSMIIGSDSEISFLSFFTLLISLFLSSACSWFTSALIILNNFNVKKALLTSLKAIWKNLSEVLLFLLFMYLLIFISAIPLFLGLFFTGPLNLATSYTSYRSIFYKQESKKDEIAMIS
ncbi:BPSS1780 family membrane protein [Xenorhabdus anantnagensis]|uniref:BPSS1780 family membrane protein n=1 Tax=Xenorhabdus anantnagensis TaxID=3025875 RepID=A0ABT5LWI4_9GAMM|nr:BPSS1780 family membrane protein [Xenorhabdus anantnagensis]MDC9597439.1 BPSS1780 family membrane protein [Xenorhabdus anantnagensis]